MALVAAGAVAVAGWPAWWVLVGGVAAFCLAHRTVLDLPGRLNSVLDLQEAAVVGAALLLPTGHVLLVAVIGNLLGAARVRPPSVTVLAATVTMVGTVPAAAAVAALASQTPDPSWAAAALVGAVLYAVGSWAGVQGIVGLALGRRVSATPFRDLLLGLPVAVTMGSLGLVVAAASTVGAWTWSVVTLLALGTFAGAHLMRRAAQSARRSLTLVHLRALMASASSAEAITELGGPLLAAALDGYEVSIGGAHSDDVVKAVEVEGSLRLAVSTVGQPPPLSRADATFLEEAATLLRQELQDRREREELAQMAATDALTGLPNRRALERFGAEQRKVGVIVLDVNNLKALNDAVGHTAGDDLLREVADKLQRSVRAGDLVVRLAGDEFVVVTPDAEGLDVLTGRIEGALAHLSPPAEYCVGVSLGAASTGADGTTFDEVLAVADARMYSQKQQAPRPEGYLRR